MRNLKLLLLLALLSSGIVSAQGFKATGITGTGDSLVSHLFSEANYNASGTLDASRKLQVKALRARDSVLFAKALVVEAKSAYNLANVTAAQAKASEAVSIFNVYNSYDGLLMAYYQLGIIEGSSGDFYQALLKLRKCLTLSHIIADKRWRARILYQIAQINYLQNENDLAWTRSMAAQEALKANADPITLTKLLSLQANILVQLNDITAATDKVDKARGLATQTKDSTAFEKVYAADAYINLTRKNLQEAASSAERAARISSKMGDPCSFTSNQLLLSKIYLAQGEVDRALKAASIGYSKASSLDDMALIQRDAAHTLSEVFLSRGDSAKAFMFMSRVKYLDDSVLNDEVNKFVLLPGKKTRFNEEPGDFEQESIADKSGSGIFSDESVNMIIMGALFLICAVLTIVLIRRKPDTKNDSDDILLADIGVTKQTIEKEDDNEGEPAAPASSLNKEEAEAKEPTQEEVATKNTEAEEKLKALEYQLLEQQRLAQETRTELDARNKHFEEMDKTKNKVFSVLTHDLRQPINQIKSVLNLLEMEQLDGEDRREIVEKLKESVDNSSNALENLLLWSKKQLTGINTRIVDVHLLPQVWQLESHLKPNLEAKKLKFEIVIPDFFKVKADMNQLDICLRNLITNAIKFSEPGGTITIDAFEENGEKIIRVIDRGVGMTAEQLDKLKGNKGNFTTLGTLNEKGTGLGIMITKEFMENQEGRLDIMSRKGEGSIFSLAFPSGSAARTPYQG